MITNFIIFGLSVPNWIFWTIGIIIVLIIIYVFISLNIEDEKRTKESVLKEKEEKRKKELERGYYCFGSVGYSEMVFFSTISQKIKVTLYKKKTKDLLIASSSWPMRMNENDLKNLQELFPELISIKAINQHQLSLKKSPAVEFFSIRENLVQHLFNHLNKEYSWLDKKTTVLLKTDVFDSENGLECILEYKPSNHLALGVVIGNINGIIDKDGILEKMRINNNSFKIFKEREKSWDELIPLIKSVFIEYFPDVEFTGDYPSFEKKPYLD